MKKIIIITGVIIIAILGIYFFMVDGLPDISQANSNDLNKNGKGEILYYRSPMNPNQTSKVPMKDEMGMDYIPVYENELSNSGVVKIDPVVVQNMNVKTTSIKVKKLSSKIITNGILKTNETQDYIVTTRVNGYIQKLYVNYTGQKVHKGEKLMDIYSPELLAAEQELLTAQSYKNDISMGIHHYVETDIPIPANSGEELVKNALRKLQLLEIPDSEINKLRDTKKINTSITLYAQNTGTVISKNILEGQKITAGQPLMEISNLSILWLMADIYEYELSKVEVGSIAKIRFNYFPGKEFAGKVSFIYPTIDPKTRTAAIRIDLPNYRGRLKPNMFAKVEIEGKDLGEYPVIPEQSVIRSGTENTIILSLGSGKFKPINIDLGNYANGFYQVLNGVSEGDKIVTSAQFLIASESNLQSALSQFSSANNNTLSDTSNSIKMEMNEHQDREHSQLENPIIRKGTIDLDTIDKNKDGKLYQDIMDWNVISDTPGNCPVCGMTLREFTIEEVKKNLTEYGFKYKN